MKNGHKPEAQKNSDLGAESKIPFPDEIKYLALINTKIEDALQSAEEYVEKQDQAYMDAKRYMVEHSGEIDPHEMFQNELLLNQTDRTGAFAVRLRDKIARLKDSPYFARIDFCEKDDEEAVPYYIGRSAFSHENELLIFDWRAPIASMFYDCEVGAASYHAPSGRIVGNLTKKRQFKIKNGTLEYALETSENIQDDILQKELSHTSDEKMKSIISTIQKEQNQIIRNEKAKSLIIQGVAGSGKTSIALHRIAFLLYRFKKQLSARNIAILSPNKVFGDYISNVIPELGEEPIYEIDFTELAEIQLKNIISFKTNIDSMKMEDEAWRQRARFKSTLDFVICMNAYIEQLPDAVFLPTDYTFGRFTAKSEWIKKRFHAYGQHPIKQRLSMVAEDISDRFKTDNIMEQELPRKNTILKSLLSMLRFKTTLSLYKDFYKKIDAVEMLVIPAKKTLEWEDVYPFLYLHGAFEGLKESRLTKHLVIDEMQDYTPIQYAVINRMFQCPKTILGDFGQAINPNHLHSLEDIKTLNKDAEFVMLTKSYRSTYEIINLAKQIGKITSLEAVQRHGPAPAVKLCKDRQEQVRQIKEELRRFGSSTNVTLGIILKTDASAELLYKILSRECDVNLISPISTCFKAGVSITSVQMSKGLEFDEVIIPDADNRTYDTDHDRNLLYIACTRAMHRLTLFFTGEPSYFLPK